MYKRCAGFLLAVLLLLSGCSSTDNTEKKMYTATFLTVFDTVTTIKGLSESEEAFTQMAQQIYGDLEYYHRLFDIYHDYEGISNLKTVNDHAGIAPVKVPRDIIDLLLDCREYYRLTNGRVNVAMGSVLYLWHESRTNGINDPLSASLPDYELLTQAAQHMSIDDLIINEEASTVFLADPQMRLDVGAVAKGWASQRAAENAPSGLLISVGGNVCATGPKDSAGTPWVIGVQDPEGDGYLHTVYVENGCMVTSGDYQRRFWVEDQFFHHIIDPDTLFPGTHWRSVTILCEDSGLADALSTALFLLSLDAGMALAEEAGVEAMWVDSEGSIFYSSGFSELIRT